MRIIKYLLLSSLVIFANCDEIEETNQIDKEEELPPKSELPKKITYLSYKPNSFIETSESDNWLVIHNQNGQLLDYRAYEKEDVLVFTALDTALITTESLVITTLTVSQNNNSTFHNLESYTDIPVGFNWSFGKQIAFEADYMANFKEDDRKKNITTTVSSRTQTFSISVKNIPGIKKYSIYGGQGVVTGNFNSINTDELLLENIELLPDQEYIFFIGDSEEGQKYIFFEPDEGTKQLALDYNDFQNFEVLLETQLPENSYLFSVSRGFINTGEFQNNFEMVVELDFNSPDISQIGYIPGFDHYTTVFHITLNNGYAYRYYEKSKKPLEQINILEKPDFTVNNGSVHDFSFDTDMSFIRTSSNWKFEENFSDDSYVYTGWRVNTTNKTANKIGELPEEIVEKYSSLFLDKMVLNSTSLEIRGRNYNNLLQSISDPSNNSQPDILETIVLFAEDN